MPELLFPFLSLSSSPLFPVSLPALCVSCTGLSDVFGSAQWAFVCGYVGLLTHWQCRIRPGGIFITPRHTGSE